MSVHGAAMAQLGYDLKWLLKESKILIRSRVIKTSSAFAPEPSQPPEETLPPDVCRPAQFAHPSQTPRFPAPPLQRRVSFVTHVRVIPRRALTVCPSLYGRPSHPCHDTSQYICHGCLALQQEQGDAGRGKRRRKSVLTPQQLAVALEGGQRSGSSSGSDFAAAAAEAAAGAESESDGGSGSDVVSEGEAGAEPVEEPEDILDDDDIGAARPKTAAQRCAQVAWQRCKGHLG